MNCCIFKMCLVNREIITHVFIYKILFCLFIDIFHFPSSVCLFILTLKLRGMVVQVVLWTAFSGAVGGAVHFFNS